MKSLRKSLFLLSVLGLVGNVYAGSAAAKLSSLADTLIKGYAGKAGISKVAIAVFPLNCEGKLEKQRVGFAASELMSHRFVASGVFTVVERGELSKLLSEQKLQASGVVDSDTAVKLGKILGAGVILAGNIQKIGGKYQVNARLVRVETAEVLVSGYEELDSEVFDGDASSYLNIVPEKQTLGIYALYSGKFNANTGPAFVETQYDSSQVTISPKSFRSSLLGYGLLYRPYRKFQINAERGEFARDPDHADIRVSNTSSPRNGGAKLTAEYTAFSVSFVSELSKNWRYWVGGGVQEMILYADWVGYKNFAGPFVRSGIEFRPQNRIGLGLSLKYDLRKAKIPMPNNAVLKLNPLSYESTLTFYF